MKSPVLNQFYVATSYWTGQLLCGLQNNCFLPLHSIWLMVKDNNILSGTSQFMIWAAVDFTLSNAANDVRLKPATLEVGYSQLC